MIDLVDAFIDSPRLVILMVLLVANYYAAYVLGRESRIRPGILALKERARAAFITAIVLTGAVVLFAERRLNSLTLPPETAQWLSFSITFAVGLPAVYWLYLYHRKHWR